jgi:hypothetical protein
MGHLAERYRDPSRSGVYRVTDAAVPRAAALEAGVEVVFIEGIDALAPEDFQAVLGALERVAAVHRERGKPFFAVLVDPRHKLPLPTLYKEKI